MPAPPPPPHFNVPMMIGTTLGRDHTFWPTLSAADALVKMNQGNLSTNFKHTHRPECTLAQMLAVTGRVREWSFSGGWAGAGTDAFPDSGSITSVFNNTPPLKASLATAPFPGNDWNHPVLITKEPNMFSEFPAFFGSSPKYMTDIAGRLRNFGFISRDAPTVQTDAWKYKMTQTPSGVGPSRLYFFVSDTFDALLGSAFPSYIGADILIFEGDKFYPLFLFKDQATDGDFNFTIQTTFDGSSATNESFIIDPGPAVAPPFNAPLVVSVQTGSGRPATLTSHSCTLKITASKYFTYQNSLGQNVYNETTGVQENDPFA